MNDAYLPDPTEEEDYGYPEEYFDDSAFEEMMASLEEESEEEPQ